MPSAMRSILNSGSDSVGEHSVGNNCACRTADVSEWKISIMSHSPHRTRVHCYRSKEQRCLGLGTHYDTNTNS